MYRTLFKAGAATALAAILMSLAFAPAEARKSCTQDWKGRPTLCMQPRPQPSKPILAPPAARQVSRPTAPVTTNWKWGTPKCVPRQWVPAKWYLLSPNDPCLGKVMLGGGHGPTRCISCLHISGAPPPQLVGGTWKCAGCRAGYFAFGSVCCPSRPRCPPGTYGTPPNCRHIK